eukprot:1746736-Amphidinium_carterae.1
MVCSDPGFGQGEDRARHHCCHRPDEGEPGRLQGARVVEHTLGCSKAGSGQEGGQAHCHSCGWQDEAGSRGGALRASSISPVENAKWKTSAIRSEYGCLSRQSGPQWSLAVGVDGQGGWS